MGLTNFDRITKRSRVDKFRVFAFLLASACASSTFADVTWTGGGADANWTTAGNWGGTAPANTDTAIVPANAPTFTVTVNDSAVANTLSATGSALTQSAGTATFGTSITLNADASYSLSGGTLSVPTINLNGGALTYTGGTLQGASTGTNPLIAASTGTISFTNAAIKSDISVDTSLNLATSGSAGSRIEGDISGAGAINRTGGGYTLTLSGDISVSGGITNKIGVITLPGTNTFSGGITNTDGTINITGNSSGVTGGYTTGGAKVTNFNVNTGASFGTAAGDTISLKVSGTALQNMTVTGTVDNKGALFVERAGVLNVNNGGTWTQAGNMTIQGNGGYGATATIESGGTFTYTGTNLIHLNGAPGNSGSGTLTVNGTFITGQGFNTTTTPTTGRGRLNLAGTLRASADIANLIVAGATAGETPVFTLTGGATIDTQAYNVGISTAIAGSGTHSLTKTGTGTLKITSKNNTYSGSTTVSAGTLDLSEGAIYTDAYRTVTVTVGGGASSPATLIVDSFDYGATLSLGQLRANSPSLVLNNGTIQTNRTETSGRGFTLGAGGGTLNVADNTVLTLTPGTEAKITGTGSLTKTGTGTLIITKTGNDYTGATNVLAGVLDLSGGVIYNTTNGANFKVTVGGGADSPATLIVAEFDWGTTCSLGKANFNTGNFQMNNGTLKTTQSTSTARSVTLQAGGGTFDVKDSTTLTFRTGDYSGVSGSGDLTKIGGGILKFDVNPTFTGKLIVNEGTVTITTGNEAGFGTVQLNGGTLNTTGNFRLASSTKTLQVTEANKTGTYTGQLNLNGATYSFSSVANSELDVQANIWNGGKINVSGAGTVNFANLNWVAGTGSNTAAPILTSTAAKINAAGNITRAEDNIVNLNAGIMSPGAEDGAVGTLTVGTGTNGSFNVNNDASLLFDFGQTVADGYDKLVVNGALNLQADTLFDLNFIDESAWLVPNGSYNIVTATLPEGDYSSLLPDKWQYYFNMTSDGTGLTLNVDSGSVPEPSTWALLLLGTAGLMWLGRRKRVRSSSLS